MSAYPEQLPSTWLCLRISDIADINPKVDKTEIPEDLAVSFVPMPAVEELTGRIDLSMSRRFAEVKKGYMPFSEGDVLFAKITPCMENGKMAVVPALKNGYGFGSTEFHVLRPISGVDAKYLYYFVSSQRFRAGAEHNMTGAVRQRRVQTLYFSRQCIPVAPSVEQRRIVTKMEELFSELENGVEALTTAREQLKAYRQSVLKHAFQGQLTAQWRDLNDSALSSLRNPIGQVRAGNAKRYAREIAEWQDALCAAKMSGVERPKKPRKPETPDKPNVYQASRMNVLPHSWSWVQLGDIAFVTALAGFEYTKYVKYDESGDLAVIKAENAGPNGFRETAYSRVRSGNISNLERSRLRGGELLMVFVGAGAGNVATVPLGRAFFLGPNIGMMRTTSMHVEPRYIELFLRSPLGRDLALSSVKSVAQRSLSMGTIRQIPIALPTVDEQREIVRLLDEKLSESDRLIAEIEDHLKRAIALRQSIIKQAFSGQLVTQDPKDEPASVLLEHICAERERGPTKRSCTGKESKKGKKKTA